MAKILFIAAGFPPYEFSENIVNGKLILALIKEGHQVRVVTRIDEGPTYSNIWRDPWLSLEPITHIVSYSKGNRIIRLIDILKLIFIYKYPVNGLRWVDRAYKKSVELIKEDKVDIVMTRSPSDITHLTGLRLKKKYNIKWAANWNDPASGIWPLPYEADLPRWKKLVHKRFTKKVLSKTDINTFPSKLLCEHFLQHYNINPDRLMVIPHIFLPDFQPQGKEIQSGCLHICHSGNLSKERDPRNLLLAISKFLSTKKRELYFDVLGVASEGNLKLIKELNLEAQVKFISPLPYLEALKKMQEYDVLLILEAPTCKGIFLPSKITDYAQLNKQILSLSPPLSEVGSLLLKYGGGIVADNTSVNDIYEKLSLLYDLKSENRLNEFIKVSSLHEYLGVDNILLQYNKLLTNL